MKLKRKSIASVVKYKSRNYTPTLSSLPLRLKSVERKKYHLSIFKNIYLYFEPKFIIL